MFMHTVDLGGGRGGISVYVCVPGVAWCIFRQQQHAGAADSFSAA